MVVGGQAMKGPLGAPEEGAWLADLRIFRRDSLSSFVTLCGKVASFSKGDGWLWKSMGGGNGASTPASSNRM